MNSSACLVCVLSACGARRGESTGALSTHAWLNAAGTASAFVSVIVALSPGVVVTQTAPMDFTSQQVRAAFTCQGYQS